MVVAVRAGLRAGVDGRSPDREQRRPGDPEPAVSARRAPGADLCGAHPGGARCRPATADAIRLHHQGAGPAAVRRGAGPPADGHHRRIGHRRIAGLRLDLASRSGSGGNDGDRRAGGPHGADRPGSHRGRAALAADPVPGHRRHPRRARHRRRIGRARFRGRMDEPAIRAGGDGRSDRPECRHGGPVPDRLPGQGGRCGQRSAAW